MGHSRGRRVEEKTKIVIIALIKNAIEAGCRLKVAATDLEIDFKTYLRWKKRTIDQRKGPLTKPKHKLSMTEKTEIIKVATSEEYMDYSPWIIVAKLADRGKYIASESSFYKTLKENKMLAHRGKTKIANHYKPKPLIALGANEI